MKLLEELKNINPRNPGSWPFAVKLLSCAGICITTIGVGFVVDWQGQLETLDAAKHEEATLKDDFMAKKKKAINLDIIKKQLLETQQSFGALLKQLPNKSEMDALLTDINQAGLGRGLQFDLFKPGTEKPTGVFAELPISIRVTGSYDDLGKFASDISQLPRIVTLNDISITPLSAKNDSLGMNATAKTYRYLDESEIAPKPKAGPKKAGATKK